MSEGTSKSNKTQSLSNWALKPVDDDNQSKTATTTAGTAVVHKTTGSRFTYTFPSSLVNNIPHPGWITQANWELQQSKIKFRPSDIFVSTFSKCGTTLAEQIVLLLLNGGKVEELNPLHKIHWTIVEVVLRLLLVRKLWARSGQKWQW